MQTLTKTQLTWLRNLCDDEQGICDAYADEYEKGSQGQQLMILRRDNMKRLSEILTAVIEGNDKRIKIEN